MIHPSLGSWLNIGLFRFGLLLGVLGLAASPIPSMQGQSTKGSRPVYQPKLVKHISGTRTSEVRSNNNPENAFSNSSKHGGVSGNAATQSTFSANNASGLTINVYFDPSISQNTDSQAIEAAINEVAKVYESLFTDPITVSILFRYSNTSANGSSLPSGTLAESEFVVYQVPWNNYISALKADGSTSNDSKANASLPSSALSTYILPSSADGRSTGLSTPPVMCGDGTLSSNCSYDGIVTLNSAQPFQFVRPPSSTEYDAFQAIEHEIDEVLGLGSYLNVGGNDLRPQDLFSWSGAANRNLAPTGSRYFSIDGGNTNIVAFNQDSGGDYGDWLSGSCPQSNPYVQNAFACSGETSDVTANSPEGINLDVIGYDLVTSPTPTPTPSPTVPPPQDESVAWQNNAQHNGNDSASGLTPPLTLRWTHDFTSASGQFINVSYPLIAQGLVIVTTSTTQQSNVTQSVVAFDEATGNQIWSATLPSTSSSGALGNAAYDGGQVFVLIDNADGNATGIVEALDAATGANLWSVSLPGTDLSSPPTAANGIIYFSTFGSAEKLYALSENNGSVLWTAPVQGDDSSPAVLPGSVFVSYTGPQAYAFDPAAGGLQWQYPGPCWGGGGSTPVYHLGKLYVSAACGSPTNGVILDSNTAYYLGGFSSQTLPAFVGQIGLYLWSGTLTANDLSTGQLLWSFTGDGNLDSAPLIVNQTIYIGSSSGMLYALDLEGNQIWNTQVGSSIPAFNQSNGLIRTGFGAGDGLLVVPAGPVLAVYAGANASPTPAPTPTPRPNPTATPTPTPLPVVATPAIHPNGGPVTRKESVQITCTTSGATIYYTLDGSTPNTSSTRYTGYFTISGPTTVKAKAYETGYTPSVVVTAVFGSSSPTPTATQTPRPTATPTPAATPTITPSPTPTPRPTATPTPTPTPRPTATPTSTPTPTITPAPTATPTATVTPTPTLTATPTPTPAGTGTVSTPVIHPGSESFSKTLSVQITCSTTGATIYYTLNGTTPTTNSTRYTGYFTISSTATVKALAVENGYSASAVATATFTRQ